MKSSENRVCPFGPPKKAPNVLLKKIGPVELGLREGFKNPSHGKAAGQKVNGKKITEKGGSPPPSWTFSVTGVFEPFPNALSNYHCMGCTA